MRIKSYPTQAPFDVYNVDIEGDAAPAAQAKKSGSKPAILMTGATHARELISTTQNLYEIMKLIKLGWIEKDPDELKLLNQNRFLFMPILNVDGVAFIEKYWNENHKIVRKRKNQD